jgi:hypothetical protein
MVVSWGTAEVLDTDSTGDFLLFGVTDESVGIGKKQ